MPKSAQQMKKEAVEQITEQVMTAGGILQSIPDGLCEQLAQEFTGALQSEHALQMTTVQRRRSQLFVDVLKAAEELRSACRSYALNSKIIDPREGFPQ